MRSCALYHTALTLPCPKQHQLPYAPPLETQNYSFPISITDAPLSFVSHHFPMPTATFLSPVFLFSAVAVALCISPLFSAGTASEIDALTSFKSNLRDPSGALDGWNSSTPAAPCDWRGIVCFGGRVRELRLPRLLLAGRLSSSLADLRQLRKLSLHSNAFTGSIPSEIAQCALLRAVYLQYNSFSGDFPPGIANLSNLQILNLAHNSLSGKLPGYLQSNLRYLDLSSNSFSGGIHANFSAASQLQLINLSFNQFTGEIPSTIGDLQLLEYLWLDSNDLYGTIPSAISNCSSLVHFSAEDNSLRGLIPATIGYLSDLQVLSLSRNNLSGFVPTSIFCNVSVSNGPSLRIVQLGFNSFTGLVKPPIMQFSSVLEVLDLHGNDIEDVFPHWLLNVTTLSFLDISGNSFSGGLPNEINNLLNLTELRLANNSLSGELPAGIQKCGRLNVLDLGRNRFSGPIPAFLGNLKRLDTLNLGGNGFVGSVPASLGNLSDLELLNLSNNNLTGKVPQELMRLANLSVLNLSNNKLSGDILINVGGLKSLRILNSSGCGFSGTIPSGIGSLLRLQTLDLSKQNLSGELPSELFGLPSLKVIALEENSLSGALPEGFSSLSGLQYLNLSSNGFSGQIPPTYGFLRSLVVLSLSHNHVSGSIPEEVGNFSGLEALELRGNVITGVIPTTISHLSHLQKLDLGHNSFTGTIPETISNCSSLSVLLLDGNHLSGHIPDSLPTLSNLTVLDLSSNRLNGSVPANLSSIAGLKSLNLSSNDLEGEIPQTLGTRFNDPSVFALNKRLCGKPLKKECKNVRNRKRRKLILFIVVAVAGSCLLALCCCGYVYSLLRWRNKLISARNGEKKRSPGRVSSGTEGRGSGENGGPKLIMFNNKITYAETVEATRQFDEENVLSRGKYGHVFKANYPDGMVLAIRRLPDASIDAGTFKKEAESLGKVKHRNLTVLRGYYAGPPPDVRLMVYDYMPNGNLATLLQEASHQDGHVLNWPMRHLIALGIARGLAFLHSVPAVHGDIKPQSVLFDADFEAHISDFGLEKLTLATPAEASSSSTPIGTLGYVAPESGLTGQATKEGDVYSYGIVLLEVLTGKKPVMFTQDEDIVKWVKRQLQSGQIVELLEPGLVELDPESSEWEEFLLGVKVGLLCTMADPIERPSMADVVFMLEGCRVGPPDVPSSAEPTSLQSPA